MSDRIGTIITQSSARPDVSSILSPREIEVLKLMAQGMDNQQIAGQLSVVQGTVKNHVSAIYMKLGVGSRAEAVAWAWKNGLISGEDASLDGAPD